MASSPYAVDRTQLRRHRGIVPVLEQKRGPRPSPAPVLPVPGTESIPMPQLPQLPSWCDPQEGSFQAPDAQEPLGDSVPKEGVGESQSAENTEVNGDDANNDEKWQEGLQDMKEPANRLPKPTEFVQNDGKAGTVAARSSSKPSAGQAPPALPTSQLQSRQGTSQRPRPRSTEKTQQPKGARKTPQRNPQEDRRGSPRRAPETRDIASSPMSPTFEAHGLTSNHAESLGGVLKELGTLRDDFIMAKLESERGRERIQELEAENRDLKKRLQEAEKQNRQLLHQKQDLEHSGDLWRQRWEDAQQQLEECWKRFDTLQAALDRDDRAEQEPDPKEELASAPKFDSGACGACQVELASPTSEVQDPPVAPVAVDGKIHSQPTEELLKTTWTQQVPAPSIQLQRSIQTGLQTPPYSGSIHLNVGVPVASPRTLPSFPSPRIQQAVRIVSVPQSAPFPNVYYTQIPQARLHVQRKLSKRSKRTGWEWRGRQGAKSKVLRS
ncbi:unnamed protein product [Durusdinium trenchii]|uniref:Uncharacterized protein n=1 Tax=Durusdinium trenchii TaxID=1381693 RepID=A0ABP0JUF8_9DINO